MSEGYTQEAVVQYRHWTTSCDDYRWCLNFNSRMWSCRQEWGGAYNKMLQEYGMMTCVCDTATGKHGLPCGLWPALHIPTESGRDSIMSHGHACMDMHACMPVAVRLTESDM